MSRMTRSKFLSNEPRSAPRLSLDYEALADVGDFAKTFLRLQHTCIKDFYFDIRDIPFMRYWKGQEAAIFTVVNVDFRLTDFTDYDALESIVNYLRPRTSAAIHVGESWQENGTTDLIGSPGASGWLVVPDQPPNLPLD